MFAAVTSGFLFPNSATGQAISVNGGSIQGTITDQSNAAVSNASVTISSTETGYSKVIKTDAAGFYSIGPLNPGTYTISVEASGFTKLVVNTVVRTGTATSGNYKLNVGPATTTEVTVQAGEVQVNTDQPGVSGVINAQQIDTLPINGRNFLDLAQLEPGVQLQDGNAFDPTKAGYSALAVNGVSGRTTRIILDGQDITDENVGTTIVNVSQGAIDEFQINHSTQDVSGDLTSTGQVLVSTRSGTNQFHGQAFYNFQDNDAGFATIQGVNVPFQRNQFGGRIGGPILKDKLFFFADSERIKQEQSAAVSLGSLLSGIQATNASIGSPYRETYSTARLDYSGPWGGHYFVRANYDVNASVAGSNYSLYTNRDNTPGIVGGADFAHGNFTHSFRGGYEKFHNIIGDDTTGNSSLYNPYAGLHVYWSAQGLQTGPNPLAPQGTFQSDKQLRYDGGWTHGAHNVRFGGEFNRLLGGGFASFYALAPQATITNSTLVSGNPSDPLNYHVSAMTFGNGQGYFSEKPGFGLPAGGQEDWRIGFYLTDAWKVRPDLTLTAGIRYNRDTGRANQDLGVIPCSDIVTENFSSVPCSGSTPLLDQFGAGLGKRVSQPNMNFGPQVGFAYSVGGTGKTVIRGGFGVYYDSNIWNNILFDRENRLKTGLFNQYPGMNCSTPQLVFPGGNVVTSINGVPLSTICSQPLSQSAPNIIALQQQYQQAVTQAGSSGNANPSFVGATLNLPSAFYTPNYVSPYSLQWNFGLQREIHTGLVLSVDYVHSATLKIQQTVDMNHVGAARYLEVAAAQNAINNTLSSNGWTSINDAIAHGATINDFMSNGLDSGNNYLSGNSALYGGGTPDTGAAFPGANPLVGIGNFSTPSGRAGYDSFQVNLRQQKSHPLPGIENSNFEVSYSFSRIETTSRGGSNAFFTAGAWDNDDPTRFMGPADLDHRHALSFGGSFLFAHHGPQVGLIGHFRSSAPSNLTLDNTVLNNIFQTDVDGDGQSGDLLPNTNPGAYMRQYGAGSLKKAIAAYNSNYAGQLTPAGKALVNAGLFTTNQLVQLNGVQQQIYNGSTNVFANPMFKSLDANLSYPIKLKFISESASLEPAIAFYNVANFAAWNGSTGTLINTTNANSDGSGAYSYVNGTNGFDLKNQNRIQRGAGTFDQGGPRSTEFQLRFNF